MVLKRAAKRILVATAGFTLTGTVVAGGCGSEEALDAVAAGLSAVAQSLNDASDENLSFGDWLLNEIEDF